MGKNGKNFKIKNIATNIERLEYGEKILMIKKIETKWKMKKLKKKQQKK